MLKLVDIVLVEFIHISSGAFLYYWADRLVVSDPIAFQVVYSEQVGDSVLFLGKKNASLSREMFTEKSLLPYRMMNVSYFARI